MRRQVELIALFVLLAAAGLRPLVTETFTTSPSSAFNNLGGAREPWTLTTLVLDAAVLLAASVIVVTRVWHRTYAASGLEWGAVLLLAAGAVSCGLAEEKRPGINATIDLLAALAMGLALVQALDRPELRRIALALVAAGAAVNLAIGLEQHFVSFAETEQMYWQNRAAMWETQGVPLDSAQVQLFERRLKAREVSGGFAHSNVAAAYFLLGGFATLALACSARGRAGLPPWAARAAPALLALGLFAVIPLTGSKAAVAATVGGLLLLGGILALRRFWRAPRRIAFAAGWGLFIAGVMGVVALGVTRGGLPGASLNFRWEYWVGAWKMIHDHPVVGVGPENFGDHYLAYKTLASSEEVKNPHNILVHFTAEYGLFGLAALLALAIGASWKLGAPPPARSSMDPPQGFALKWGVALALGIFLARIPLLPGLDSATIIWATGFGLLSWVAGYALATAGTGKIGAASPAAALALSCGLLAFLLQDLVNFAWFVPAARTTFIVLLAAALAQRATRPSPAGAGAHIDFSNRPAGAWAAAAFCTVACAAALLCIPAPARAEAQLRSAREALNAPITDLAAHPAEHAFQRATDADAWDAAPPTEHAQWLMRGAARCPPQQFPNLADAAAQALQIAQTRAPRRLALWRAAAQLHTLRARVTGDPAASTAAVAAIERALEVYPNRPMSYIELGDALSGRADCASAQAALAAWEKAQAMDDARPAWEIFQRFNARQRAELTERLARVRAWLAAHCG